MGSTEPGFAVSRQLLASYALTEDGTDAVGGKPCKLQNIVFEEGGAMVGGRYEPETDDICTPRLEKLDQKCFAVTVEFQAREVIVESQAPYNPADEEDDEDYQPKMHWVVIAGQGHRWFGVGVDDGVVMASLNNQREYKRFEDAPVESGTWHTLAASYDHSDAGLTVQVWLDGAALEPWVLPDAHPIESEEKEKQFMTTNYSNGMAFHGLIRNLQIYGRPILLARAVVLEVTKVGAALAVACLSMAGNEIAKLSLPAGARVGDVRAELEKMGAEKDAGAAEESFAWRLLGSSATELRDDADLETLAGEG